MDISNIMQQNSVQGCAQRKPRILLITSSFEENTQILKSSDKKYVQEKMDTQHYPIGIAYLHSYVESRGNDIRSLFLNSYSYEICFEEVEKAIREFSPDIVGLQMLTQNRVSSYRLMEKIHRDYPHIKLVAGGIHATIMFEQLVKKYPFLIVVIGEGEITFVELIRALMAKSDIFAVEGIAFNRGGEVVRTMPRPLIENLDMLPFPKHELFFDHNRAFGCMLTSRGCPFRCSFCALESITRRAHRTRSIKNVVDEVELMAKKFPQMKRVWIHDDTFFLNNQRAIEFCDEVIRRGIKLEFVASGRLKPVTCELIKKLEQANFVKILFGLESGTDEILFAAHKGITQKDVVETFKLLANTSKIEVVAFLIVGLPGETLGTVYNSARFVQSLQKIKYIYYDDIGILIIYPGTEVYRLAKEHGIIDDEFWLSDAFTPLYTAEHSLQSLYKLKKIMLEHIALKRIASPGGFKAQLGMLPYIPKYLWGERAILLNKIYNKIGNKLLKRAGS